MECISGRYHGSRVVNAKIRRRPSAIECGGQGCADEHTNRCEEGLDAAAYAGRSARAARNMVQRYPYALGTTQGACGETVSYGRGSGRIRKESSSTGQC